MKTYQVFDYNGKECGVVTTKLGMADAARKARLNVTNFPVLVEMPKQDSVTVLQLVERKTQFECWLAGVVEEQIAKFEDAMCVKVQAVGVHIINPEGFRQVQVDLHLNINTIEDKD